MLRQFGAPHRPLPEVEVAVATTSYMRAQVRREGGKVMLLFDRLLGDQPITEGDGSVYEYVMSEMFYRELNAMDRFGIRNLEYSGNCICFIIPTGFDELDSIARVVTIVADFHNAVPFVILPNE